MGRPKGSRNKTHVAKVPRTCEFCGRGFEVYPSVLKRAGHGRFCSGSCQRKGTAPERKRFGEEHAAWKGGTDYRRRALRDLGERCERCGYDRFVELLWVHHKNLKPRGAQDDHSLDNLEVLCVRCHQEIHIERREEHRALRERGATALHVQVPPGHSAQMDLGVR